MSFLANNTKVLYNGYDLSEFLNEVDSTVTVDGQDATTFGNGWRRRKAGIKDSQMSAAGLYDQRATPSTEDAPDDVLPAALGAAQQVVTVVKDPAGDSFGAIGFALMVDATKYEIKEKVDELAQISLDTEGSEKDRVVVLHALGLETATGNGTDHDDGSTGMPTTNGAVGYLHVTDLSSVGGDSIAVKIQHSSDGTTWVDLITFTTVTADHKAERVEVSGTVNRHVRAVRTLSAGASATFHVAFARKP